MAGVAVERVVQYHSVYRASPVALADHEAGEAVPDGLAEARLSGSSGAEAGSLSLASRSSRQGAGGGDCRREEKEEQREQEVAVAAEAAGELHRDR